MKRTLVLGVALAAGMLCATAAEADHCQSGGYYGGYRYNVSPYRYGYSSYQTYGYSPGIYSSNRYYGSNYGYHNHYDHNHNHYHSGYRSGFNRGWSGYGYRSRY